MNAYSSRGLTSVGDELRAALAKAEGAVDVVYTTSNSALIDRLHDLLERASSS